MLCLYCQFIGKAKRNEEIEQDNKKVVLKNSSLEWSGQSGYMYIVCYRYLELYSLYWLYSSDK